MRRVALALICTLLILVLVSCPKSVPPPPLPPAPSAMTAAKPTVSFFSTDPQVLVKGQSVSVRWSVKEAATVQIDNGIGEVGQDGQRVIQPVTTTTYHLQATNSIGTVTADATVTVRDIAPPASAAGSSTSGSVQSTAQALADELQDIHFDYGQVEVLAEENSKLQKNAEVLRRHFLNDPTLVITIEGHCDERGSSEYNMALGDRRANFVKATLVNLGPAADKLNTATFGKEHPLCLEATEICHAQNRRAHFSAQ